MTIVEALDGSQRDLLDAMRRALARRFDDGEIAANALSAVSRELRELDRLVRALDAEAEVPVTPAISIFDRSAV